MLHLSQIFLHVPFCLHSLHVAQKKKKKKMKKAESKALRAARSKVNNLNPPQQERDEGEIERRL